LRVKRFQLFLPLSLLAAGWLTDLAGCSLPVISPEARAYSLVAGVNAVSRDVLADNFVPTITNWAKLSEPAEYPNYWETQFPYANGPYSVTALDASNPAAVTLTVEDNQTPPVTFNIVLVMQKLGNDWFIAEMQMPAATVIVPMP
jgi:hypothetical protein